MGREYFYPHTIRYSDFFSEDKPFYGKGQYFYGFPYQRGYGYQNGAGLGGIFAGLLRFIIPMLKVAGKEVGKEALFTGAKMLGDIIHGSNIKNTIQTEAGEAFKRIFNKRQKRQASQSGGRSLIPKKKRKMISSAKLEKNLIGKIVQLKKKKSKARKRKALGLF